MAGLKFADSHMGMKVIVSYCCPVSRVHLLPRYACVVSIELLVEDIGVTWGLKVSEGK